MERLSSLLPPTFDGNLLDWIALQFQTNEFLIGIVGGSILGFLLYLARSLPSRLWNLMVNTCSVSLTIHNNSAGFEWINLWLSEQPYAQRARRISLVTKYNRRTQTDESSMTIGAGLHYFWYNRKVLMIEHTIDLNQSRGMELKESYTLRTVGRSQKTLLRIIAEAKRYALHEDSLRVYVFNGNYWEGDAILRHKRSLTSVWLPDHIGNRILQDLKRFYDTESWYTGHGIPYRRGYLLHGPPGCGKTSLVLALASTLGRPIYFLNLGSVNNDGALQTAFRVAPSNAILVLEDIDAAQRDRESEIPTLMAGEKYVEEGDVMTQEEAQKLADQPRNITLSGLLNALDGVASQEGQVVFMTTNYVERIDAALLRPGRADMKVEIGPIQGDLAQQMFQSFYSDSDEKISDIRGVGPVVPALIQEACLRHREDPESAAQLLRSELTKEQKRKAGNGHLLNGGTAHVTA